MPKKKVINRKPVKKVVRAKPKFSRKSSPRKASRKVSSGTIVSKRKMDVVLKDFFRKWVYEIR